jgi:cation diffusion facilitator CzcD-associated flavoprotein CzcO
MTHSALKHRLDTVVVGGGQAGLAIGYYLKEQERDFVILDARDRVGDAWRRRWDSLRLFTPAALSGLPGMPFPFPGGYFPTKDEMADYLEEYARKFDLPVRLGRHVDSLRREGDGYLVSAGEERYWPRTSWWLRVRTTRPAFRISRSGWIPPSPNSIRALTVSPSRYLRATCWW